MMLEKNGYTSAAFFAKRLSPLVATVLIVSALGVGLAIWEAIAPFVPHAFYGVSFTPPIAALVR
jgi:hypothetical protein